MAPQYVKLVPDRIGTAAHITGVRQTSDRTQREMLTATGDHDGRVRLLQRLGFQDRVLSLEVPAVECRALLGPHGQDKPDGLLHLPNAHRGS